MASGTLFGGPLSTRAACTNWDAVERVRQQEEAAAEARARKLAKAKSGGEGVKRNVTPPPPDPSSVRKNKLKEDLDAFDDLNTEGGGPKKPSKAPVRATTPPPQKADSSAKVPSSGPRKPGAPKSEAPDAAHRHITAKSSPVAAGKAPVAGVRPAIKPGSSGPGRPVTPAGGRPGAAGPAGPGRAAGLVQGQTSGPSRLGQQPASASGARPDATSARSGPSLSKRPVPSTVRGSLNAASTGRPSPPRRAPHPSAGDYDYDDGFLEPDEEEEGWRKELRGVTGYDPRRFRDHYDDRSMVAGWRDVEAEEKRSARLGRAEDEDAEEDERRAKAAKLKALKGQQAKKPRVQ